MSPRSASVNEELRRRSRERLLQAAVELVSERGVIPIAIHEERFKRHPEDYPPRVTALIEEGLACRAADYARTKEHQRRLKREILESFLDGRTVAITPATAGPAPDATTTGLPTFHSPWSYTGLPTVSFLSGWTEGLPLAVQLAARPWEEDRLLTVAAWCEQTLGARSPEVE